MIGEPDFCGQVKVVVNVARFDGFQSGVCDVFETVALLGGFTGKVGSINAF